MKHWFNRRNAMLAAVLFAFAAGLAAQKLVEKPKSVIHVVTVKWKDGTTPAQIKAAMDGVEKMAAAYPAIKRVWLRSIKVQSPEVGLSHAFVMEFESEEALKKYAGSKAQKEWYEVYLPIREQSRTHDITN